MKLKQIAAAILEVDDRDKYLVDSASVKEFAECGCDIILTDKQAQAILDGCKKWLAEGGGTNGYYYIVEEPLIDLVEELHDNREYREWLDRQILHNVNELMEALFRDDQHIEYFIDSCENYYYCHECECRAKDCTNDDHDHEPQDSLEYWLVTERFGELLIEQGEPVYNYLGLTIWGRTCSGQAIALDYSPQQIYKQLKHLPDYTHRIHGY